MKRYYKRMLSFLLVLSMIVALFPTTAFSLPSDAATSFAPISRSEHSEGTGSRLKEQLESGTLHINGKRMDKTDLNGHYEPSDAVNVMIELKGEPLISHYQSKSLSQFQLNVLESKAGALAAEHEAVKKRLGSLFKDSFDSGNNGKLSDESKTEGQSSTAETAGPNFEVLYDYFAVINGISIEVEYQYLEQIQQLEGVKRAWVANTYKKIVPEQSMEPHLANSVAMIGAPAAIEAGYTGKGTTVAVIDTGLDWQHEAFATNMPPEGSLKHSRSEISEILSCLEMSAGAVAADDVYMNDKVPFAYDYADRDTDVIPAGTAGNPHGTHVAGIIAANSENLKGVAPDAQLMIMKVFGDSSVYTTDAEIVAGLDDAVKLGADVINMSLGSDAGFSTAREESTKEMHERIYAAGINLVASAGNGYSSAYGNKPGYNLPYAGEPDNSIVGEPSTYDAALSVASMVNSRLIKAPYMLAGDRKIVFYDTSNAAAPKIQSGTYDYVPCGFGSEDEISAAGDLTGKIALISRGNTISFQDKVNNADAAGSVAAVVYNNEPGSIQMSISEYPIPAVSISQEDGNFLASLEDKRITVHEEFVTDMANPEGYRMSAFSSWGVAPDLKLKPEITAPGEKIYSAVPGNAYLSMSGTSMAAPHIAGAEAVVKQYVNSNLPISDAVEQEKMVLSLLMSTARPAKDEDGQYYSPRKQGAGLADVNAAVTTGAYLSVDGNTRPKAELGYNREGVYAFAFDIQSISDETLTYSIATAALSEKIVTKDGKDFFAQQSIDYAGNGIDVRYDGLTEGKVTVAPGGKASVTVTITLSDAIKEQFDSAAENGTFIDGFVMLDAADGVDLSLPFAGFYGDWGEAAIFDGTGYGEAGYSIFGSVPYCLNSNYVLGQNFIALDLGEEWGVEPEKFVISPSGLGSFAKILGTQTGLLRNAESLTYTVMGKDGTIEKETDYTQIPKSYYDSYYGFITWAEAFMESQPFFDGLNENSDEVPEGMYTYTVSGVVAGTGGEGTDSWSFDFAYDKTGPELTDYKIYDEEDKTYLELTVKDNHYISGLQLAKGPTTALSDLIAIKDPDEKYADGSSMNTKKFDISDLEETLAKAGLAADKIELDMYDYALNYSCADIILADFMPEAVYTLTPIADEVFQAGTTPDGIHTMTVNPGFSGLKYFGVQVTPVTAHSGEEAVVFTHQRDGAQLGLKVIKADFDAVPETQANFNVQPGDVIKVYIVDDLTNAPDLNPIILQ